MPTLAVISGAATYAQQMAFTGMFPSSKCQPRRVAKSGLTLRRKMSLYGALPEKVSHSTPLSGRARLPLLACSVAVIRSIARRPKRYFWNA